MRKIIGGKPATPSTSEFHIQLGGHGALEL